MSGVVFSGNQGEGLVVGGGGVSEVGSDLFPGSSESRLRGWMRTASLSSLRTGQLGFQVRLASGLEVHYD